MKNLLKKTGYTDIMVSIAFAIIGIFMIINTNSAIRIIAYILGGIFIVIGIIKTINYFSVKGNNDFFNYDLIYGVIAIIVGLVMIFYSGAVETMLRVVIGVWIMYSGLLRLSLAIKLRKADVKFWNASLVMAILMIACGIYITFTQGAIVLTIGIIMLIYSIMDLVESAIFMKNVKEL